ncbi:MAG: GtrA family protein [Sphingomonas sp.]
MIQKREFASFVLIGGFAAAMNWAVRFPINAVTSFEIAVVLAYLIAMTLAFVLNRVLVFKASDGPWLQQYAKFALVNVVALVQVFVVTVGLARFLFPLVGFIWHAEALAHAIGLASPVLTSYWAHKRFSFARSRRTLPKAEQL